MFAAALIVQFGKKKHYRKNLMPINNNKRMS